MRKLNFNDTNNFMKKTVFFILFCTLCFRTVSAQSGVDGSILWKIDNGLLSISGSGDIPDYDVMTAPWHTYVLEVVRVEIDNGITGIGNWTFNSFQNLSSVSIPNTVTKIGEGAFYNCISLTTVTISTSVTTIGGEAFSECNVLSEIINTSPVPQIINNNVFEGIPVYDRILRVPAIAVDLYKNIPEWAMWFADIVAIEVNITFSPASIHFLNGMTAFEMEINATVTGDVISPGLILWGSTDPKVATIDPVTGIVKPISPGKTEIVGIIGSTTAICPVTVYERGGIDSTISWGILNGVLYILGNVDIPNYEPEKLPPWYDFRETITCVDLDKSITHIGNWAFSDCNNLVSVNFSSSLKSIGYSAFRSCTNLSSVSFPNLLNAINMEAFWNCISLTSVTIPNSVNYINNTAFLNCRKLVKINVEAGNESYSSVDGVLFAKDEKTLVIYPCGRPNSHYDVPATVTFIGFNAFVNCTGLISITFPKSLTDIGFFAFLGCVNLNEIVNNSVEPQNIDESMFLNIPFSTCFLRVPAVSVDAYKTATGWKMFANIAPLNDGLKIDIEDIYLLTGASSKLTAIFIDEGSGVITWESSHPDVATVSNTGTVQAFKAGTAVITASNEFDEAICMVTVIESGKSTIEGIIANAVSENARVNLYIKTSESATKKGIIGGYVLLASTVPNSDGQYSFDNLPEGAYKIEVEIDNFESGSTYEIPLRDGETFSGVNFNVDIIAGKIFVDLPTGTSEIPDAGNHLIIYPNPFKDVLHLAGSVAGTLRATSLHVINTAGTVVHTQLITHPDEIIHLGHLPPGMYFIRLENSETVKVIKIQ